MRHRFPLVLPALALLATLAPGCARRHRWAPSSGAGMRGGPAVADIEPTSGPGEDLLEGLPWKPDVFRVSLGARGPVALTQVYAMDDDILAVDTTGKVSALSRRDLGARWVSSLRAP